MVDWGSVPFAERGKSSRGVKVANKVKVFFCLMVRAWEVLNGGMHAWVGRARTAAARFLRSIIDRCVSLLDSIAAPFWLSFHSRSWSLIFLCFKASLIAQLTFLFTHPPPHSNRPPWLLSSRPVLRSFIPSLYEEPRTRIS